MWGRRGVQGWGHVRVGLGWGAREQRGGTRVGGWSLALEGAGAPRDGARAAAVEGARSEGRGQDFGPPPERARMSPGKPWQCQRFGVDPGVRTLSLRSSPCRELSERARVEVDPGVY